jgi:hypothetical protein
MARQQVQDLPTKIAQPERVVAGQYRVQVQEAPRNKLQGLASALQNVNTGLQAYTQAGVTYSEMYEQEIKGMTNEQLEEEAKRSADALDSAERKGFLPPLMNPRNWERNRKAIGKQYAQNFYKSFLSQEGRLYNGKQAGDDDLTVDEIVNDELETFIQQNQGIANSTIISDTFYKEWNNLKPAITQQFADRKQKQFVENNVRGIGNTIYASATLNDLATADGETRFANDIIKEWEDTATLTPNAQKEIVKKIALAIAEEDPAKARDFLTVAKNNLTIGQRPLSEELMFLADLRADITDIQQQQDYQESRETSEKRRTEKENVESQTQALMTVFNTGQNTLSIRGNFEWRGKKYESSQDFTSDYVSYVLDSTDENEQKAINDAIAQINEYIPGRTTYTEESIINKAINLDQQIYDADQEVSRITAALQKDMAIKLGNRGQTLLGLETYASWKEAADKKLNDIKLDVIQHRKSLSGREADINQQLQDYFSKKLQDWQSNTSSSFAELYKNFSDDEKAREQVTKDIAAAGTEGKAIPTEKLKDPKFGAELIAAWANNFIVLTKTKDKTTAEQARLYIWGRPGDGKIPGYDTRTVRGIIDGRIPMIPESRKYTGFGRQTIKIPAVPYPDEAREQLERLYLSIEASKGVFTQLDKFKKSAIQVDGENRYNISKDDKSFGYPINVNDLNITVHRILTEEELKTPGAASVIKKAEMLNRPVPDLIKAQKELYKEYGDFYKRIEPK